MYVDTDWEWGGGYLDPIVQFDFVYQNVVDSNKNEGLKMFYEIDCHNGVHVNQLQVLIRGFVC